MHICTILSHRHFLIEEMLNGLQNEAMEIHKIILSLVIHLVSPQVLIETVRQSEHEIMVMASILLGQLLHLTNVILPSSYLNDAHCLPKLVGFALDFETLAGMERMWVQLIGNGFMFCC